MAELKTIEEALAALEQALDAAAPGQILSVQGLDEIDLGPAPPAPDGPLVLGVEDAAEPALERLRAALGEL